MGLLILLSAGFAACNNGNTASHEVGPEQLSIPPPAAPDGIVRPPEASLKAFEVSTVDDADDMDRTMVPAVVTLKDSAVSAVVSPVTGRIEAVHVVEGERVQKGDILATVRSPELINLRAELRGANARLGLARDVMQRQLELQKDGVAVASEISAARSALSEAESDVARLRDVLRSIGSSKTETLTLRARRDGVVMSRRALVGDAVGPDEEPLMFVGDTGALWLVAQVFEGDLERVVPESSVRVHLPGGVGETRGRVVRVGDVVETALRRAPVWVELDDVAGLRPGMMGQAGLRLRADSSLRLPPNAVLLRDTGEYRVWVEVEEGAYEPRPVVVGQTRHGLVEVMSGLKAGERVVTKGALLLDASASMRL